MRKREDGKFSVTRTDLVKSSRVFTLILLFSFSIFGIAWFLLISGYFTVKNYEINDLYGLDREVVVSSTKYILQQGKWTPWNKENILFIDENNLGVQLKDRLFAENVVVDKTYPNILRLMITERQRSVVVVSKDQVLTIDMSGLVTEDALDASATHTQAILSGKALADNKHPPIIKCDLPELATAGYQVTDQTTIKTWIEAYRALIAANLKFRYLRLDSPISERLKMASEDGYEVVYDLGEPLEPQIESYKKFIQSKPKNLKIDSYVDVRIPGRIYVK